MTTKSEKKSATKKAAKKATKTTGKKTKTKASKSKAETGLISPAVAERRKLWQSMPKTLQSVAVNIQERLKQVVTGVLSYNHAIGLLVRDLTKSSTYGDKPVEKVSAWLGTDKSYLYSMKTFAEQWQRTELKALTDKATEHGMSLNYMHFIVLSSVSTKTKRDKWIAKAIEQGWSAEELRAHIPTADRSKLVTDRARKKAGRKLKGFSSTASGLHDMVKKSAAFLNRLPVWREDVLVRLAKASGPEELTDDAVERLLEAKGSFLQVEDLLKTNCEAIDEVLRRVEDINKHRNGQADESEG